MAKTKTKGAALMPMNGDQSLTLMKLPLEVKVRIFGMCVNSKKSMQPVQLLDKSNKFAWSRRQITGYKNIKTGRARPLTVVALTMVCKEIYELVALGHLFYRNNHFAFTSIVEATKYLVAITTPRREAIRSLSLPWTQSWMLPWKSTDYNICMNDAFTMIASCKNLRSLELKVAEDMIAGYVTRGSEIKSKWANNGFEAVKSAVRGLQRLSITSAGIVTPDKAQADEFIRHINIALSDSLKQVRTGEYNLSFFRIAQGKADLDVHGEGRISKNDKKPGIVSSRTRGQVKKLENITDDGVIPTGLRPKYDGDGMLAWHIYRILDSRVTDTVDANGEVTVEFDVKCFPLETTSIFWESAEKMLDEEGRRYILRFYRQNKAKPGLESIARLWKSNEVGDKDEYAKLAGYIKRDAKAAAREVKQAELAKKKAEAKAAKDIKAAKKGSGKKVV